ncbi:MAG: amidohydrolase [Deltaproteobacteria bacterium]|jgi:predicted amidohydrolase YtcJ|nr:amidohydrolase [Deltaproteobacteria bacterium]
MAAEKGEVFYNGNIRTMDPERPRAGVLASLGGRIVFVGDSLEEARDALSGFLKDDSFRERIRELDLQGGTVVPGLIDSHSHLVSEGLKLTQLDLAGLGYRETLEKVREKIENLPPGVWLHGRGWDDNLWGDPSFPDKRDLDEAAPENPVVLDRVDKHSNWLNSMALELSRVDGNTRPPAGGAVLKNPDGSLKGVLVGRAMKAVWEVMPPYDGRNLKDVFTLAENEMLSLGLTTVVDCGTKPTDLKLLRELDGRGELRVRFRGNVPGDPWLPEIANGRFRELVRSDHLSVDGVKLFSDGSLGSRSAWLFKEYHDRPGHFGSGNYEDDALLELFRKAAAENLQAIIHAIGDRAIEQAVRLMMKACGSSLPERRFRVEHYQVTSPSLLKLGAEAGIVPSIQSAGIMYDMKMAPARLGPGRVRDCYAWRRILDGGYLVNGSDAPIESPNPFHGIYAAVTRRDLSGYPDEGFQPYDALSLEEAFSSYTVWSARAAFQENNLGSLKAGKFSDFVLLDRDPWEISAADLKDVRALMTVVGGEIRFRREEGAGSPVFPGI